MTLDIRYADGPLGHEIRGVDLAQLDDASFAALEQAFDTYGCIVIRGQSLTPARQVDFSRRFGPLDRFVLERFNLAEQPEIFVLSNILEDGRPIGLGGDAASYWHSDMWVSHRPPRGSILHALEVPHRNGEPLGDTCFASTAHAYDTLSEEMKARIEGLQAVFSRSKYAEYVELQSGTVHAREMTQARKSLATDLITHSLVRRHPRTGRKCLYVVEGVIDHIVGMTPAESEPLLAELLAHVVRAQACYRHRWQVGDVVMWDNYSTLHRATSDFQLPERRLMHRTTLSSASLAIPFRKIHGTSARGGLV